MDVSTSTVSTLITNAVTDLGAVLGDFLPSILGILVALLALGMGVRYFRRYITGRKF